MHHVYVLLCIFSNRVLLSVYNSLSYGYVFYVCMYVCMYLCTLIIDDQQQDSAAANYKAKASVEEDQSESGTVHKELFPQAEREEISLWGAEIARCSTGGKLTRELIEICNEIVSESGKLSLEISLNSNEYTKRSSMETVNMLKMKLQETCGSVQQVIMMLSMLECVFVVRMDECISCCSGGSGGSSSNSTLSLQKT